MNAADPSVLASVAADSVGAIESLHDGDWRAPVAAATAAVDAAYRSAEEVLLPSAILRIGTDALAAYEAFAARISSVEDLAHVHERCLLGWPDLARAFRSLGVLDVEALVVRSTAPLLNLETHAHARARVVKAAIRRYLHLIATAIAAVADHELEPAARALLATEELARRLDIARQRHELEGAAQ